MADNSRPAAAGAPLIRPTPLQGEDEGIDLRRLLPAWIISGVIHVVVLALLMIPQLGSGRAEAGTETAVIESSMVDDQTAMDKNLENDEIGNDPDLPTNYNVDRIEENSVPGPVNPNERVGILNAADAPAMTIAPPPGFGGGQGGAIDDPNRTGQGGLTGFTGGMGGPKLQPGGMGGRSGATREKMIREGGGNTRSEAAVAGGLKWIVRHQALDGHWGMHDFHVHGRCNCGNAGGNHDVAGTGFGLLPLLGAGETHKGTGKNHLYAKNVERALKWYITRQGADGSLSGNGYEHAIATLCLCEAYGLTADPILKGPAQRAINCCVAWQHTAGGFRYGPRTPGDTSVHGWFVQALKSGAMAGLNVPNATFNGVNNFLDSVANPEGSGYGYTGPQVAPITTAVGLLCREYMGWGPRNVGLQKGLEYLRKLPPSPNFRSIYYYYYATQVVHHMAPFNPEAWEQWNPKMRDMLIESQDMGLNPDKRDQKGSWSPEGDNWGGQLGRLGVTSLSVLTLEVYYRHLPLYR
ncbi:MAG: terpene cyclase/mutase family protein, partial [Planctomycetia bacterium]|nr:terpene cyclase/mutase family protein [Planctomycetia bacterium]